MSAALVGRAVAALGVVLGLIAIWLDFASVGDVSTKYSNDGTVLAYLLVTLILTTLLLGAATVGTKQADLLAAVTGTAAFGFYLFGPASFGFNHFDLVDTGGWLGVCTGLIPLGMAIVLCSGRARVVLPHPLALGPILVGRILCIVAIWLDIIDGGPTYWNFADEGRALPAAMLVLVIGGAVLGAATWLTTSRATLAGALIAGAATFGLYGAIVIGDAFDQFGDVGAGGWLGAVGASVLMIGLAYLSSVARGAPIDPLEVAETPAQVA